MWDGALMLYSASHVTYLAKIGKASWATTKQEKIQSIETQRTNSNETRDV
jgi:hypothetical protein